MSLLKLHGSSLVDSAQKAGGIDGALGGGGKGNGEGEGEGDGAGAEVRVRKRSYFTPPVLAPPVSPPKLQRSDLHTVHVPEQGLRPKVKMKQ